MTIFYNRGEKKKELKRVSFLTKIKNILALLNLLWRSIVVKRIGNKLLDVENFTENGDLR